jgi:hypothetical protein
MQTVDSWTGMPLLDSQRLSVYSLTVSPGQTWSVASGLSGRAEDPCEKIYMLVGSTDPTIHYVGQTATAISTRFARGFAKTTKYPYRWSTQPGQYRLFVWDMADHCSGRTLLEAVEAELVLGTRIAQWGWPQQQTGISFRHIVNERGRQIAPPLAVAMMGHFYDHLIATAVTQEHQDYFQRDRDRVLSAMQSLRLPGVG